MKLTPTEKRSILQGHHPALSRETKAFKKGEVIAIRSLRSLQGPVPVVSIKITNVKKKDDVYLPEYTIRDDRPLYLKRGAGYTRAIDAALDPEASVLDAETIEGYAMEAQAKTALQSAERVRDQKQQDKEARKGSSRRSERAIQRHAKAIEGKTA